jgi:hypothetical protein
MAMYRVGFKPMIPVFERAKTFRTLDRMATVICKMLLIAIKLRFCMEVCIKFRPVTANNELRKHVIFGVITAVVMLSYFFWTFTLCTSVKVNRPENFVSAVLILR